MIFYTIFINLHFWFLKKRALLPWEGLEGQLYSLYSNATDAPMTPVQQAIAIKAMIYQRHVLLQSQSQQQSGSPLQQTSL